MAEDDADTTMLEEQREEAAREEHMMYGHGAMTVKELAEKYPNRPHNHGITLPFRDLYLTLFNPLNENKRKPTGPVINRKKVGPHGARSNPQETRRTIIVRFIDRWRKEVGNDIFPAFRLIVPEKDRDRAMYGLKESTLGKLLVRVMKIDKNSEDGYNLLHWKLPGVKSSSALAGDFAGRCYEVISKRPMRTAPGDMSIAEVNELLDRLSVAQKEENQQPIIAEFYKRMNAEELKWLIRMILRQMKIGASEKTLFEMWHPDAENLFNISSSLRRVCWELYDLNLRLEGDDKGIKLMQCFQPQLAAFQMRSMEQMVARMGVTEEDPVFWIEEKLDGERLQLHMVEDPEIAGGMRFGFWSRRAKDYAYLYGTSFHDENGALTRYLKDAFADGVQNIILDGEMITWNPREDKQVAFGTLKTAALNEQTNPFADGNRPLYRVFDCLYLNNVALTRYALRERRKALTASIKPVHRRFEIHEYTEAQSASEIEPLLREVVAGADQDLVSEGLVLKNPRSGYRLNERNDDWIKVKPEYMHEFGESLDCLVIGGYYGSGHRGGRLSSFLCGLRVDTTRSGQESTSHLFYSFFKVGGGFAAADYAEIRHRTEGKWIDWNAKKPPVDYIELGGHDQDRQYERPDVWIKPEDSFVVEVKAASVAGSPQFRIGKTLRFPRFKKIRTDKDWHSALTLSEFEDLRTRVESERTEKKFKIDDARRKKSSRKRKRDMVIQGQENSTVDTPYGGPATSIFEGLKFFILSEKVSKPKKTKAELEQLVKANGGTVVASRKDAETICISDRNTVPTASIVKDDDRNILRPQWLLDCVSQSESDPGRPRLLLALEPGRHLFHTFKADRQSQAYEPNVDEFGDSYCRNLTTDELSELLSHIITDAESHTNQENLAERLAEHLPDYHEMPGSLFSGTLCFVDKVLPREVTRIIQFAGGSVVQSPSEEGTTHVVVPFDYVNLQDLRRQLATTTRPPRLVKSDWVLQSWKEITRLDEERFAVL